MSRIDTLIQQMTLDEKIAMLAGADLWHTVPVPRLGIPALRMTDGPNGARGSWGSMGPTSACFPVGIALGATWNVELIERIGQALGDELKSKGAHILLAPTVNIHRTPIAGRNFECFAEDPYLSGQIAAAYIKGLQARGVGACIKHFVCNDQEYQRTSISAEVQERPLRELYLEPFRIAIRAARPWAVMSAYNRVNGVYACRQDHTLREVLKEEWGFDGIVISDWFGTYDPGVPAGKLDLEMPGPARWMGADHVKAALASGALTAESLDDKVRRLLGVLERAGLFENPELQPERADDRPEHRAVIREAAREAIVLLKNDGALPLDSGRVKSIAVIGPYARTAQILGGGSSMVTPHYAVSPFDGLRARAGSEIRVETAPGCHIFKNLPAPDPATLSTAEGERGLRLSLFDNLDFAGPPAHTEVTTRVQHGWFESTVPGVNQEAFSLRMEGFFTPQQSGLHTLALSAVGWCRLFLDDQLAVDHWADSDMGQQRTAQLQLEAGRRYALRIDYYWKGSPRWRSLGFGHLPPQPADLMAEAVELARRSDAVILIAGLNGEWEAEGFDRADMKLPGRQNELIERVAAANPNTTVVLNVGSAVEMPWLDNVKAVLQLWYDSQEQGNALADIVFGDFCPSGKLPTTFPVRLQDNPAYINYPGENGQVHYGEGLFVGYRYYDKKEIAPLFPFGHGLSYTTFEYRRLTLSASETTAAAGIDVSVDVANTGQRPGQEVVQVYVRDVDASLTRPPKELKAFAKVALAPGQSRTVTLHLDREALWFYDPARGGWVTEPGQFEVLVGASSRDIRLKGVFTLLAEPRNGARLHLGLSFRALLDDPAGRSVVAKHLGGFMNMPDVSMVLDQPVEQVAASYRNIFTPELVAALADDLAKV